jgi:eukaryotic-like serine/threonine-protein kinase
VNTAQLALLSRLLDEALALPTAARTAWLAALPPEARPLQTRLARALAGATGGAAARRFDVPQLSPESGADGVPGERVGPWRLQHLLGRGGMGSVWAAERADGLYQRQVALKLPRLDRNPTLAARMEQERRIAARLEHPGIARLYDAGVDEQGRPYLVMERVDGSSLAEHAAARGLGFAARVALVLQVADALAHAHRMLVVHRDIKPGNLLVDAAGRVKLLDFGVARLLADGEAGTSSTLSDSVRTHTPRYGAPEQRRGGPVGTATDLYALALVLHELLTGSLPATDAAGAAVPGATLPLPLRAVLACAWQVDPARRQPSVAHFADELRDVLGSRVPASWHASGLQRLRLWARRHHRALAWSGAASATVAAAAGLLLAERTKSAEQQARGEQARLFLTTTLANVEPPAGRPGVSLSGPELIDDAIARTRAELIGQPTLQAEVMGQLAVMQRRLGRPGDALALLRQAHGQMQAHADPDDAGRQGIAGLLALEEQAAWQRSGDDASLARVQPLARDALQHCTAPGPRCARARAYAHAALRNRASALGDDAAALAAAAAAVQASADAFGAAHAETVMARVHEALVLRNADRPLDAEPSLRAALAAAPAAVLRRGDATELRLVQAMVDGDLGHHDAALRSLDELLSGLQPGSPDLALLQRLRAQSLWSQGRLAAVLAACASALEAADAQGDAWEALNALQWRTHALSALGRPAEAERSLAEWSATMAALGDAAGGLQRQRWQRAQAELALRGGRVDEALAITSALTGPRTPGMAVSALEQALNWDLHGAALRVAGRPAEALKAHRAAGAGYGGFLPATHPLRLRSRLEAARAAALDTPGPGADAALRDASRAYLQAMPAESAWRALAEPLAAGSAAESTGLL